MKNCGASSAIFLFMEKLSVEAARAELSSEANLLKDLIARFKIR
ncbi:hypothetical protein [Aminipila sp.]|nr:hypothetical protein [Aminipila sp.]